jgi:hypothetical protein
MTEQSEFATDLTSLAARVGERIGGKIDVPNVQLSTPNAKWRVMSGLQKAIRRGNVEQAITTAAALVQSGDADHMLRRLCVIALEDIAFGDVYLCVDVFAYCGYSTVRKKLPEDALYHVVRAMAETPAHDRSPCELATRSDYGAPFGDFSKFLIQGTFETALAVFSVPDLEPEQRVLARFALGGILHDGAPPKKRTYAERHTKTWHEVQSGWHPALEFISRKCLALGGEPVGLISAMREIWDIEGGYPHWMSSETAPEPPAPIIHGLASVAYDMHCHEGKRAISYFRKACEPVRELTDSMGVEKPNAVLGDAIFEVEGKWCKNRVYSHWGLKNDQLSRDIDARAHGVDPLQFYALQEAVYENMDMLNYARDRVMQEV